MKIVGILQGDFEGKRWYKLELLESIKSGSGYGYRSVSSKCTQEIGQQIAMEFELYENQEVILYYDRFGRVMSVTLAS